MIPRYSLLLLTVTSILVVDSLYADPRDAQHAYKQGNYEQALADYQVAIDASEGTQRARFTYNAALSAYALKDYPQIEKLLLSMTHERDYLYRSNALLGLAYLQQQASLETDTERYKMKQKAADAFLRALQADPDNPEALGNLARAQSGLDILRKQAHIEAVMKANEKEQLNTLIPKLLTTQRALMKSAPEVFTSQKPEVLIRQAEELSAKLNAQSDLFYPVEHHLKQAVKDETALAEITKQIHTTQEHLQQTAQAIANLDNQSTAIAADEPFMYDLWKGIADPPAIINESIAVQNNAITTNTPYQPARRDKDEVKLLADHFKLTFPEWADQQIQQRQQAAQAQPGPTLANAQKENDPPKELPPFTTEDKDKIIALAATLDASISSDKKQETLDTLTEIRTLLPKSNQDNQQNQEQQEQEEEKDQEQEQQEQNQEQQEQDPQEQEQEEQQEKQEEEQTPQDVQNMLQRALDREREHEAEKDKRARATPLPQDERDW